MSEHQIDRGVLPNAIVDVEQWICWRTANRDGKQTKVPIIPGDGGFASATDEQTWTDFATAVEYATRDTVDGLGFVFSETDPFVGVDLDDCRVPATTTINDEAGDIIARLDSYTEISPSGTGFHVLLKGELPEGRNRKGSIEMYDSARFFTMTGDHLDMTPTSITEDQEALAAVHREYVQDTSATTESAAATTEAASSDVDLDDEELLERARNATNGEKFARLWRGDTSGYESQSEADMALCCLLAFWTGGDRTWMDQLFRQSGLMRTKWDEVHYADGATYGEKTTKRAIARTSEFYDPNGSEGSAQDAAQAENQDAGMERTDVKRDDAYLVEKNRLLADRVDDLKTTLEARNQRIEALEAKVDQLETELDDAKRAEEQVEEEEVSDDSEDLTTSVWTRTKQLFGEGHE